MVGEIHLHQAAGSTTLNLAAWKDCTDLRGGMVMTIRDWPTTVEIGTIFEAEIAEAGGTVIDRFEDGTRLLARSVLPGLREVGRDDLVQGGVAIRATDREIRVHPYLFRQVCQNGA